MSIRKVVVAVVAAAVIALAGCATIPRSGPVHVGENVRGQDNGFGPVDYLPSGPLKGATQKEILRGFIDAAVSPQNGYAVAQEFLTPKFATTWNPDASVTVDTSTDRTQTTIDATHVMLSVTPVAFVDADGNYRRSESSTPLKQPYTFQKVKNEWRISKAPNGVVIDSPRFTDVFSAHALYFFSPDFAYLVPDERWFPARPTSIQTRVVKALLAGPAKWLEGAVVSAFPQGSALTADSVPVDSGNAQVPLNNAASGAPGLTLQRMKLQLTQSLTDVTSVTGVTITIGGVERSITALAGSGPIQDPPVDPNPLVIKDGKFGFLSGNSIASVSDISDKVLALAPSAVTLSADHQTAAVLSAHGVYDVRASVDAPKLVDSRPGIIAPSLDNDGFVWTVPAASPKAIQVAGAEGAPTPIAAGWPGASSIQSIAVSRDGTRLAALVQADGHAHVMAAGIIRSSSGVPAHLGEPVDFGVVPGSDVRSLTWLDELSVAALSTAAQGEVAIETQVLGGELSHGTGPEGGRVLAGGSGAAPLYWVLSADQSLQIPRGTGWQQKADAVTLLGTQLGRP